MNINDLNIWSIFIYKWNNHIILWVNRDSCYVVDIEYNPLFDDIENPIYKLSWWDIEEYYFNI